VLFGRPYRFPLIVEALAKLRSRSCIIDGEAVSCGPDGIANFDRIRYVQPAGREHDLIRPRTAGGRAERSSARGCDTFCPW
jgi:hypothetical protein